MSTAKKAAPAGLAAALLTAQQAIGAVGKDAHNAFGKYDYVSAEAMIKASRVALHSAGVLFYASGVEVIGEGRAVQVTYRLSHPATAEELEMSRAWPICPGKGKPEDKALAGALTACLSYTLRDLLLIARVDPSEEMDDTARPAESRADLQELAEVSRGALAGKLWTIAQLQTLKATTGREHNDDLTRAEVARLVKTITTTIGSEYAAKETT
jgi:hypothetical protein